MMVQCFKLNIDLGFWACGVEYCKHWRTNQNKHKWHKWSSFNHLAFLLFRDKCFYFFCGILFLDRVWIFIYREYITRQTACFYLEYLVKKMQSITEESYGIWRLWFPGVINVLHSWSTALCLQYSNSIMRCLWVKFPTWNCYDCEGRSIMCPCVCVCIH